MPDLPANRLSLRAQLRPRGGGSGACTTCTATAHRRACHGPSVRSAPPRAYEYPDPFCSRKGLRSEIAGALVRGLYRATVGGLVIDDDRRARVEWLLHLEDLRGERDVLSTVVSTLTGDECFDDAAQGVGTEPPVGNKHGYEGAFLWPALRSGLQPPPHASPWSG
jgi:hypothetical protein